MEELKYIKETLSTRHIKSLLRLFLQISLDHVLNSLSLACFKIKIIKKTSLKDLFLIFKFKECFWDNSETIVNSPVLSNYVFEGYSYAIRKKLIDYIRNKKNINLVNVSYLNTGYFLIKEQSAQTTDAMLRSYYMFNEHKASFEKSENIIEFGAGYGALALVLTRSLNFENYFIVDLKTNLNLIKDFLNKNIEKSTIQDNVLVINDKKKITFHTVDSFEVFAKENHRFDLFIAIYSLSEASQEIQEKMSKNNFYGSENLLISCNPTHTLKESNKFLFNFSSTYKKILNNYQITKETSLNYILFKAVIISFKKNFSLPSI